MENLISHKLIISCEHAGNEIPPDFQYLFSGADDILKSHLGWDPGSKKLAEILSEITESPLILYPYTRLLIETNRSVKHPKLFSEFTKNLPIQKKNILISKYYQPHRNSVENLICENLNRHQKIVHLCIHTFTPSLGKKKRSFEIGLLYDPKRTSEKRFCQIWKHHLKNHFPEYRVRMNQPYKGSSDGFTTYLRKKFTEETYLGIELELNQALVDNDDWEKICVKVGKSLTASLYHYT